MTGFEVRTGDCLAVMRTLADSSVDSVVTDPPYELGFMGKSWDASGVAFRVEVWREALRVLKPGGHLLAFSGSRTYHRMAVAIEDAGFEIRDQIMWVYGSGFPKSHDVSKAIDAQDAIAEQFRRRLKFTEWVRSEGATSKQINNATRTNMGTHYTTSSTQPAIMTREHLEACRHLFHNIPAWVEKECDIRSVESKNMADREVVGSAIMPDTTKVRAGFVGMTAPKDGIPMREVALTAPATPEAQRWSGWGTALKPAHEPIVVARKPLIGTVAQNVLSHGTGAINVDGCRLGTEGGGRWPANLIHDGSDEVEGMFPYSKDGVAVNRNRPEEPEPAAGWIGMQPRNRKSNDIGYGGHGSAARFFYSAKASKRDRDEGLDGFRKRPRPTMGNGIGGQPDQQLANNRNIHPTVKPTDLMRYLCRLVTPPGGLVLDPFTGSGSTGKGAVLEGFRFIGIELSPEYAEIARARIRHAVGHVAPEPVTEAQVPDALPGQLRLFA